MSHEVWEEYYDRLAALVARPPDDAGLREHAADGRARGAAPERPARGRRGHGAPRQPVEGDAARRRDAPEGRRAPARSSRPRRSSSASTSATSTSSARSDRRTASRRCSSGSGGPGTRSPARRRDGCSPCRATTWSSARRCCARSAAASSIAIVPHDAPLDVLAQQIVAEMRLPRLRRGRALRSRAAGVAVPRAVADRLRRGGGDAGGGLFDAAGPARGAPPPRRGQPHGPRPARRAAPGADLRRRDSRGRRLPRGARSGRHLRRHAERGLRHREHAGDIFQLGNASWRILQVAGGTVRVADAQGAPPTIPFWLGEAPARSDELSCAVSDLRTGRRPRSLADGVRPRPIPTRCATRAASRICGVSRRPPIATRRPTWPKAAAPSA